MRASTATTTIDVLPETEEWWVQEVIEHRGKTSRNQDCTPGYYNFEGEFNRRQDGNYNGGFQQYFEHMTAIRGAAGQALPVHVTPESGGAGRRGWRQLEHVTG